jgi:putative hydrolase of the HAD superfamily
MVRPVSDITRTKKALVFDLFHTLVEVLPEENGGKTTSEILGVDRSEWSRVLWEDTHDRLVGIDRDPVEIIRKVAHAIDPTIPDELIQVAAESRLRRFAASLRTVPESSLETLAGLKSANIKIGLISNADTTEVAAWPDSPLAPFFDSTIMSCDVGKKKPDRAIYELSLQQLGLNADDVVFVGDGGSHELLGAKSVGLTTVMMRGIIGRLYPELLEERRHHADYEVDDLTELLP